MSREATAKYIKKSETFANKWIKRYKTTNIVICQTAVRHEKYRRKEDKQIIQLFYFLLSLCQEQSKLKKRGTILSPESTRSLRASNVNIEAYKNALLKKKNMYEKESLERIKVLIAIGRMLFFPINLFSEHKILSFELDLFP